MTHENTRRAAVVMCAIGLACKAHGSTRPADATSRGAQTPAVAVPARADGAAPDSRPAASTPVGHAAGCLANHGFAVPRGTTVVVDGAARPEEWADAARFTMAPTAAWRVPVSIKHDGLALLVLFEQVQPPKPPPFAAFPEIMVDIGNDKAATLGPDDWWFHVSATDCHQRGGYDDYRSCTAQAVGWEANNFPSDALIATVEARIEFATLGIDPTVEQDIGLLLRLSDTRGFAAHWPDRGTPDAPATWATVRLCPAQG